MLGAVHPVIACLPAAETVAPCGTGMAPGVLNAYLIAASAQPQFEASMSPTDYAQAASFWAVAFLVTISLWSFSQLFSHIRRAIR